MFFSPKKRIKNWVPIFRFGILLISCLSYMFCFLKTVDATNLERGQTLFFSNCNVCHVGGKNVIIPEKNLKKETLETNGMNQKTAIVYQVINGKNGMPAFGGRLEESEIEEIAAYVLEASYKLGFEKSIELKK
jgi:cytochrome c6